MCHNIFKRQINTWNIGSSVVISILLQRCGVSSPFIDTQLYVSLQYNLYTGMILLVNFVLLTYSLNLLIHFISFNHSVNCGFP
jgi:hypothetical protein